jgi:proline dehydrogenase
MSFSHHSHARLIAKSAIYRCSARPQWMNTTHRFKSAAPYLTNDANISDTPPPPPSGNQPIMPDFDDARGAYASKTTPQLLRASVVYNLCGIPLLIKHADMLLRVGRRIVGNYITDKTLKLTLFGHFCAGEDEGELLAPLKELQARGIGGILDYAAESDFVPTDSSDTAQQMNVYKMPNRVYDYESEAVCDEHVEVFRSCIRSVHKVAPDGFAAVKVTALGNPKLLERMSKMIVEAENLFTLLDHNGVRD